MIWHSYRMEKRRDSTGATSTLVLFSHLDQMNSNVWKPGRFPHLRWIFVGDFRLPSGFVRGVNLWVLWWVGASTERARERTFCNIAFAFSSHPACSLAFRVVSLPLDNWFCVFLPLPICTMNAFVIISWNMVKSTVSERARWSKWNWNRNIENRGSQKT